NSASSDSSPVTAAIASRRLRSRVSPALTASTAGAYRGRNDTYPRCMPKPRVRAVVEWWSDEEGWGALAESDEAPGGVFVHFSAIQMEGYRTLRAGQRVDATIEGAAAV